MNLVFHFLNSRNTQVIETGTELFRLGEKGGAMYVILEGSVRIHVRGRALEIAGPGSIVGEMALIDDQPRSATVVALSRCCVVPIGRAEFSLLVREKPEFALHVMKVVADRLRRMNANLPAAREARQTGMEDTVPV
jgi:CRP/FNR family cyclic AMP-dependent transcriptional regulator